MKLYPPLTSSFAKKKSIPLTPSPNMRTHTNNMQSQEAKYLRFKTITRQEQNFNKFCLRLMLRKVI